LAEQIIISNNALSREQRYVELLPQIKSLLSGETDLIANLANLAAALKESMGFFWVGFYLVKGEELVLGPFQGPVACTRIGKGKGVCGTAWMKGSTIIVEDVDLFPGHIACSSSSRSEIVVPAFRNGEVFLVLDVDSVHLSDFNAVDEKYLGEIIKLIEVL
jgi:L-methionine (R)-S-oxide reductase